MVALLEKLKSADMIASPSIRSFAFPVDGVSNKFLISLLDYHLNKAKELNAFNSKLFNVAIDDYGSFLRSIYSISRPSEYLSYSMTSLLYLSFHFANTGWDISSQYIKAEHELLSLLALPINVTK